MNSPAKLSLLAVALQAALGMSTLAAEPITVEARIKDKPGKAYPTRTLDHLPAMPPDAGLDAFGGLIARKGKATGFFHTEKIGGRWWLVDPKGGLFLHKGVTSVTLGRTPGAQAALKAKFGDEAGWAKQTSAMLLAHGFNGVGAWADTKRLSAVEPRLVYTRIWNFMSTYGKKRGGMTQQAGHAGYPNDTIFVFDPEFEKFCDEHARQLTAEKDDPWLLGHFSDNELPLKRDSLKRYLELPESDPGHRAAVEWRRARPGGAEPDKEITAQDEADFGAFAVDRYHRIVSAAIRKYDPNHLFLGSRFQGSDLRRPEVLKAAGRYLDIVSANYYGAWSPDPKLLAMWERESGRPAIITEWYAKGADSGMANTTGAGWTVKTQRERGLFYQNFVLGVIESRVCVGWHWFKYADNDPTDTKADPSNRDANKGIVTARYEPWKELLDAMKPLNQRAYGLVDHFDQKR